jgi:hypothetical protein
MPIDNDKTDDIAILSQEFFLNVRMETIVAQVD